MELSRRLVAKGHTIVIVAEELNKSYSINKHSGTASATLTGKDKSIKIYHIPVGNNNWFKKFRIWFWIWSHRKLIQDADVIHCHDVFFWYLPFRFLFPAKKVYTTFHGYEGNRQPTKRAVFMHYLAQKLSRGNICVGQFLAKWYGTKPTLVTYGATHAVSKIDFSRRLVSKKNIRAVFTGRLEEETGILEYLKAAKILQDKGYNFNLQIVGNGSQRRECEQFCLSNKLNAQFTGFVPNPEDFLLKADVAFVSRYLSILEALSRKIPVFALYNNAIKKDYLQMTPFAKWIKIATNAQKLSKDIEEFIKNPKSVEQDVNDAYLWAKGQTWEKLADQYLWLWKQA